MADAVIDYDVGAKHTEVKKKLKALGYQDFVTADDGSKVYLPNTTLVKTNTLPEAALQDIQKVATQLGVGLERAIAFPLSGNWNAIHGVPHSA